MPFFAGLLTNLFNVGSIIALGTARVTYSFLEPEVEIIEDCRQCFKIESKGDESPPAKFLNAFVQHILVTSKLSGAFLKTMSLKPRFFDFDLNDFLFQHCHNSLMGKRIEVKTKKRSIGWL